MAEHVVGRRQDLPPGGRLIVRVEGREIGVFNLDGNLYALGNTCADQAGPVCEGRLFPNLQAEITPERTIREYVCDDGCILACPWHGWEYDIRTGVALWNPRYRLRTYAVREDEAGNIAVVV